MSYEDTIRVADLKVRAGRFKRVREEVRAGPEEILGITEYMHPRPEEVCETLPAAIRRRRSGGHTSELQALIRNQYDVFCLPKQSTPTLQHHTDGSTPDRTTV